MSNLWYCRSQLRRWGRRHGGWCWRGRCLLLMGHRLTTKTNNKLRHVNINRHVAFLNCDRQHHRFDTTTTATTSINTTQWQQKSSKYDSKMYVFFFLTPLIIFTNVLCLQIENTTPGKRKSTATTENSSPDDILLPFHLKTPRDGVLNIFYYLLRTTYSSSTRGHCFITHPASLPDRRESFIYFFYIISRPFLYFKFDVLLLVLIFLTLK